MKNCLKIMLPAIAVLAVFLTSCDQDEATPNVPVTNNSHVVNAVVESQGSSDSIGCLEFIYPFEMVFSGGNKIKINNHPEFQDAYGTDIWDFIYPISFRQMADGAVVTANNVQELKAILAACNDKPPVQNNAIVIDALVRTMPSSSDSIGCYTFVYPFEMVFSDGSTIAIDNHDEFTDAYGADVWDFVYPLWLIKMDTGLEIKLEDETDIQAALDECN